jgi:hypothetical protein
VIERAYETARDQQWRLGYVADLLECTAEEISDRRFERDPIGWSGLGMRVDYLAELVRMHVNNLGKALDDINETKRDLGGAQ